MIRELHATVAGRAIRYLQAGAGWPVLLLHAFPVNADLWRPQLERVPEGWRFIAPDIRGFGPRAGSISAFTLDDVAADVAGLMDQLELDRAVIGGISMGGYAALAMFRRYPERFDGMLLADTKAEADTPEGRDGRRKMIQLVCKEGPTAVADQMLPKLLSARTRTEQPQVVSSVREMIESASVEPIAATLEALMARPDSTLEALMARPDSTPDLPRIHCPTLIIVGAEDEVTPEANARTLEKHIERSRLVVLPDAGHLSNIESPDAFSLALSDFLASNM